MTNEQKFNLLLKVIKEQIKSKDAVSQSFANSKDYVWAEKFRVESSMLQEIEMMMEDEKLLKNIADIFHIKVGD